MRSVAALLGGFHGGRAGRSPLAAMVFGELEGATLETKETRALVDAFQTAGPFSSARDTHAGLQRLAEGLGWRVSREPSMPYTVAGATRRPARMDFVAERAGVVVACELDRASPRRRTIAKLTGFERASVRLIVLREGGRAPFRLDSLGILVVSTRVRTRR
jgi:hypothetical protein